MHNPFMARSVARVLPKLSPAKRVVEFGNQRYRAAGVVPGTDEATTTKEFYRCLGFEEYLAIDTNTERDAIIADLNLDLAGQHPLLTGTWDLVTNNGTGEHVFDQAAVFRNAHYLSRIGGIMLHVLPFSPWLNHGFYNYNPILFRDLGLGNGYEIVDLCFGTREGPRLMVDPLQDGDWFFEDRKPKRLRSKMRRMGWPRKELYLAVGYRRIEEQPFRAPIQGKYQGDNLQSQAMRAEYDR